MKGMSNKSKSCIYSGSIAWKMPTIHTNPHLSRTVDVVHKMSEISTHENQRSGVKYYWGIHRDSI